MTTLSIYETLRRCFGEGWDVDDIHQGDMGTLRVLAMQSSEGTVYVPRDQLIRDRLLSAALDQCEKESISVQFRVDRFDPRRFLKNNPRTAQEWCEISRLCEDHGTHGSCGVKTEFVHIGHGPDPLSRLADALSKWKEAQ